MKIQLAAALALELLIAGCTYPMSGREQGALIGGSLGLGGGALLGGTTGALIGGVGGAVVGGLIGQGQESSHDRGRRNKRENCNRSNWC